MTTKKNDALVINLAGRQRMLTQLMMRLSPQVNTTWDSQQQLALQEAIRTFDQTLWALQNGGSAPYTKDIVVNVPLTQNQYILTQLEQIQITWNTYRDSLNTLLVDELNASESTSTRRVLDQLGPQLLNQSDSVVQLYEADSTYRITMLHWIQIIFFCCALGLLVVGFFVVQRSIVMPLQQIEQAIHQIAEGHLEVPVEVKGAQEFVDLAQSTEIMRQRLHTAQLELLNWTAKTEAEVIQRTRELTALHEVNQEISSRLELNHVLCSVTEKTRTLLNAEVAYLCLLDQKNEVLNLGSFSGPSISLSSKQTSSSCNTASQTLTQNKTIDCSANCSGSCGIVSPFYRRSQLAAPLRIEQTTIGALCIGSTKANQFTGESISLLTKLADSAAIALENARLYEKSERVAMLEERHRIAAEMHDGVAQTINYLKLRTEQAIDLAEMKSETVLHAPLEHIYATLDKTSKEVRQAISNLQTEPNRPDSLQKQLSVLIETFQLKYNSSVQLINHLSEPFFLSAQEVHEISHIVQEAMLNSAKHAQAKQIIISLLAQPEQMVITIVDDGCGFEVAQMIQINDDHFGLEIMQARAIRVHGEVVIDSTAGQGTCVTLSWPLNEYMMELPIKKSTATPILLGDVNNG
ncbi:type IV pili methyl-accepting chemotaxis transducer N-terminal domain-containing protein [Anaerolineales bacterium HSG6]|nr:type IV pili methyl-accepting chemotaxis transducer N-terminal domain-containing protein [Anaerolineales bacterium HSG6]